MSSTKPAGSTPSSGTSSVKSQPHVPLFMPVTDSQTKAGSPSSDDQLHTMARELSRLQEQLALAQAGQQRAEARAQAVQRSMDTQMEQLRLKLAHSQDALESVKRGGTDRKRGSMEQRLSGPHKTVTGTSSAVGAPVPTPPADKSDNAKATLSRQQSRSGRGQKRADLLQGGANAAATDSIPVSTLHMVRNVSEESNASLDVTPRAVKMNRSKRVTASTQAHTELTSFRTQFSVEEGEAGGLMSISSVGDDPTGGGEVDDKSARDKQKRNTDPLPSTVLADTRAEQAGVAPVELSRSVSEPPASPPAVAMAVLDRLSGLEEAEPEHVEQNEAEAPVVTTRSNHRETLRVPHVRKAIVASSGSLVHGLSSMVASHTARLLYQFVIVLKRVATNSTLEPCLSMLLESTADVLCTKIVSLYIINTAGSGFDVMTYSSTCKKTTKWTVPSGKGVVGYAFDKCTQVLHNDIPSHPSFSDAVDAPKGFVAESALYYPIIDYKLGKIVGVLQVLNKKSDNPTTGRKAPGFCNQDKTVLEVFATMMSGCWVLQRLRSGSSLESESVELINRVFSHEAMLQTTKLVAECAMVVLESSCATLYLVTDDHCNVLGVECCMNKPPVQEQLFVETLDENPLMQDMLNEGKPIHVRQIPQDSRYATMFEPGTRNALAVPIHDDAGVVIGMIVAENKQNPLWSRACAKEMLHTAIVPAAHESRSIYLRNSREQPLDGAPPSSSSPTNAKSASCGTSDGSNAASVTPGNAAATGNRSTNSPRSRKTGVRPSTPLSNISPPMRRQRKLSIAVAGAPDAVHTEMQILPQVFTESDEEIAFSLGNQVLPILKGVHLFNMEKNAQARSDALIRTLKVMTSVIDTNAVNKVIVKSTFLMLAADRVHLYLLDAITDELVREESTCYATGARFPTDKGPVAKCIKEGKPLKIDDVASSEFAEFVAARNRNYVTKALLCVPIRNHAGVPVAVIECENKSLALRAEYYTTAIDAQLTDYFTDRDVDVLDCLCNQASISLHRSLLHNRVLTNQTRSEALLEIVKAGSSEADVEDIIAQVIHLTYKILDVERVTLFIVDEIRGELWCKISKDAKGFRIPLSSGVVGHVATTGTTLNIPDAYKCDFFNPMFDKKTNFRTRTILCMPVKDKSGKVIAVTQAINKRDENGGPFTTQDVELLLAVNNEIATVLKRKSLEATFARFLSDSKDTEKDFIQQYVNVHNTAFLAPGGDGDDDADSASDSKTPLLSATKSVEGSPRSGSISIPIPPLDSPRGSLSMPPPMAQSSVSPIVSAAASALSAVAAAEVAAERKAQQSGHAGAADSKGDSPAGDALANDGSAQAAQESNKVDTAAESKGEGAEKPGSKLSPAVHDNRLSSKKRESKETHPTKRRSSRVNERMFPSRETLVKNVERLNLSHVIDWGFDLFKYSDGELVELSFHMFDTFNMIHDFNIDRLTLHNYLVDISKNYNNNPYHNFKHAFSVLHCAFLICYEDLYTAAKYFTPQDVLAIFVASICHDLNHPGVNNAFKINADDELAILYNDQSVLENHHAAMAFKLMYKPENHIFKQLKVDERRKLRKAIVDGVLSTDVAHHFGLTQKLTTETHERTLTVDQPDDRQMAINAVIHSADLCNSVLPFDLAVKWADLIVMEFKHQAELEQQKGIPVTSFMVNATDKYAQAQINLNFIDYIVAPLWRVMALMFPKLSTNIARMDSNRAHWSRLVEEGKEKEKEKQAQTAGSSNADGKTTAQGAQSPQTAQAPAQPAHTAPAPPLSRTSSVNDDGRSTTTETTLAPSRTDSVLNHRKPSELPTNGSCKPGSSDNTALDGKSSSSDASKTDIAGAAVAKKEGEKPTNRPSGAKS